MISDSLGYPPYPLFQSKLGEEFVTDFGARYALYLSEAAGYFEGYEFAQHTLTLGLMRLTKGQQNQHDPRVAATLLAFVERAFMDRRLVLVYVCDQTDNLQQQRHRLFDRLFNKHNQDQYLKLVLVEEQTLYASLLYHRNNPFVEQLRAAIPAVRDKLGF